MDWLRGGTGDVRRSIASLVVSIVAAGACSGVDARPEAAAEPPAPPARIADRIDSTAFRAAFARAAELSRLRSLLVSWKDTVRGERYYGGATATAAANIKSASKSVMSALVGIAIAQGRITGVESTIGDLLPDETRELDSATRAITVADLLSMRAGLQSTSFENYGAWVTSRNWVRDALLRPRVAPRGDAAPMIYSTGNTHLLSAIVTKRTGMSTHRFAQRFLAPPLGIVLRPWQRDPQGIFFGGTDGGRGARMASTCITPGATAGSSSSSCRRWSSSS